MRAYAPRSRGVVSVIEPTRGVVELNPPTREGRTAAALTLLLAGVLLLPAAAPAQEGGDDSAAEDSTATLTGQVVSAMTGGPLGDVRVLLKGSGLGAFTDSTGRFTIPDAPPGRDTVQVSLIGFAEEQVPLTLEGGHVTRVTLMLSESVLRVEDITVEVRRESGIGKLAGFWKRKKTGLGAFLTPRQVEEKNAHHTSDYLRGIPGVRVGPNRFGKAPVKISRARMNCEPTYYVDGTITRGFHIDEMNQDDILAIEVYRGPSEAPARFSFQGGSCGTIVIWTREGQERRTRGR